MRFSLKIWACIVLYSTWCHACWAKIRKRIVLMSVKTLSTVQMLMKTWKQHRHRWWNLGLWLWYRNKSPVFAMGPNNVTQNPKKHRKFGPMWKWCCFFYCVSVVYHDFLPRGQMVNKEYYLKAVRRKRPDLWRGKKLVAPTRHAWAHFSLLICDFLTKHETTLVSSHHTCHTLHQAEIHTERTTIWVCWGD